MSSSFTITASSSSTFTEARVRYVMDKVFDDFVMIASCGFASIEQVRQWIEEITTVLLFEAAELFQIKFARPDGLVAALTYNVTDNGSVCEDAASGGLNYFAQPAGTKASIVIRLRTAARKRENAVEYLKCRGWTFDGSILEDSAVRDRSYSSSGYGVTRTIVGKW